MFSAPKNQKGDFDPANRNSAKGHLTHVKATMGEVFCFNVAHYYWTSLYADLEE